MAHLNRALSVVLAVALFVAPIQLNAQDPSPAQDPVSQDQLNLKDPEVRDECADITGRAVDAQDKPLVGASVRLRVVSVRGLTPGQSVGLVQTDNNGAFVFKNVKSGTYLVELLNKGGKPVKTEQVEVNDDCIPPAALLLQVTNRKPIGLLVLLGALAGGITAGVIAAGDPASAAN